MTPSRLIVLILIYVNRFVSAYDYFEDFNCKIIEEDTPLYQLKRHLFCDYDPQIRPGDASKNATEVHITVIPEYVQFMSHSSSMKLHSWLIVHWIDPFLTWKPDERDKIKEIAVRGNEIWFPEVYTMDPSDEDIGRVTDASCRLAYNGAIICIPSITYIVPCVPDYTYWPWDTHNCTLQLGAWGHSDQDITFGEDTGLVIDRYRGTDQWKISLPLMNITTRTSKLSGNATFPIFTVSVLLTRTQTVLKSVFVTPVIILTVMTMTILWLRPGSTERLILCCLNLLGHLLVLRNLHWKVPSTGRTVPNILVFYNNSLILSTLILILSCWLQNLLKSKREVPVWLVSQVSVILTSKVGQVLTINIMDPKGSALLQDDADDNSGLVNSQPKNSNWENVVTVIGWLLLFTFGFTYFIMCLALLT
ncbi:neuronal acetylcholine receptor subunit alpha-5 [Fopius arisanus]|uniref:Neuronal acetylcholine receptor subunit alpha-5 n=1 Tax=Fopius arisanus TaxID=64838 RepID=A0A9R1TF08_9HYME|nr:PREDICTED: neuronal acetylcholine receptor subunit alpha-5-like [Fopius arisanus]